ncbi:WXG100 family type VII secretion target [Frigoribacterium sp. CFBP9039]|uniref:WXG100 family type VII secretion target n=1 Tax=Frigoribacterium TaxID=96492 RepID=UPI00177D5501|nr:MULTISPECIES: WXG100 family type VII secretion target [Frigoribacterium]MBD8704233.1 WXG100 family type VII secretion target [Frigoribacterium sp. CFBP 13712]MCJ0700731.1 WXG100 family type VII secretion target [Frigoribacterium faeni]MDY0945494.1 WXG100 family type VII secretion target [Frigoribacterium sp. CFBP9039]
MANVTVTYDDLRTQSTQLRNGQRAIEDQLGQLKSQIANLVSSGYVTDKSSKAFDSTYSEFTTGATTTIAALEGLAGFLESAANALESTDAQLASSLG